MAIHLGTYSMGIGDRFGHQGPAQLKAIMHARNQGLDIVPVWNKSNREHQIIGTRPEDVRAEADAAVSALEWKGAYFVDADHINLSNVDAFIASSDFFTLDVADSIGRKAQSEDIEGFVKQAMNYAPKLQVPGIERTLEINEEKARAIAEEFLFAVQEAGQIYGHIVEAKGSGSFVAEVSMDETDRPQSPLEMFFILMAISREGIPAQTIAPRFTGRFNKGVDYVGDVEKFEQEFRDDIAVIRYAVKEFGLPDNLKLSVHSGSDKFSIYGAIRRSLEEFDAGVHLKTAGTTWLEEIIGLASAGDEGLLIAKEVYRAAMDRMDELCKPYASVIDIDRGKLPSMEDVEGWDGQMFAESLRHDPNCERYNPHLRQLLHVGYKVAAEMGTRFTDALEAHEAVIAEHVAENLYERHIKRAFDI